MEHKVKTFLLAILLVFIHFPLSSGKQILLDISGLCFVDINSTHVTNLFFALLGLAEGFRENMHPTNNFFHKVPYYLFSYSFKW